MDKLRRALCFLLTLTAGFWTHSGWAETCRPTIGQIIINLPNITYSPTLPQGMQMTDPMPNNGDAFHFTCDRQPPAATWKRVVYQQSGASETIINGRHVFASSVTGIGYSLGLQCGSGAIRYIDGADAPAGSESVTVCDSKQMPTLLSEERPAIKIYVIFYKTAEVSLVDGNHAAMNAQPDIGSLYIEQRPDAGTPEKAMLSLGAMNIEVGQRSSCQVTTPRIKVNMGSVKRTAFHGTGQPAGDQQPFFVPVQCTGPATLRIAFSGVADAAMPDTLALTQGSSAARGVGIQLRYGDNRGSAATSDTLLKINDASNNLPLLKTITADDAGRVENINFTAQYVQTAESVIAGEANSMATFELIYN
ncbi:fimbrial protein [Mixta gaviniae]|uniref:Fimbrial protein n=1 Tax=Mixta gaviniae TaxID=665914 RepID=A0A1X1DZX0_9GAMM|nr:fimbrial protein [Mixta gaviniae]AUX91852.1 fimbrial protein [Mixta gaviniae]ORM82149.1 fimbrial protein [Mixta gaviniae]